ncbi:T9SS type A sorting domain-containing protein [Gaetbulibacter aquiaggeris]|uniref:T9SS type A sorting domain-containing protein n=1 Tax=Gaetbulibacter aquiaggeris TaxID=1735373 RepID=A0ABW7MLE2_9FLAO
MKKNYFSLLLTLSSIFLIAQNNDFNNGGGDLLWSNPANWTLNAVPGPADTVRLPLIVESQVDAPYTITKIQTTSATSGDVAVAGSNLLTINPGAANGYAFENVSMNDVKLSFKGNVTLNNPSGFSRIGNANGASNSIEFEDGSTLTLTTGLDIYPGASNDINFNGTLAGSGNIRFPNNSVATFGSTASNSGYSGQLVFIGSGTIIVNTADNNIFYDGPKIQVNQTGGSITLNGANVFPSGITVGGTHAFTLNVNKNQSNMTNIIFQGSGTLNMAIGNDVTNLTFADNSASAWNTGTLNITNFTEGVVRFGTDNAGLTAAQLSQIVVDNGGGPVALDSAGYLVLESSLSTNDIESGAVKRIAYPTLASNKLFFSRPQQDVKVFDLNGRMIIQNQSKSQTEIAVSALNKGLYFIVFDNKIAEKFIKQ